MNLPLVCRCGAMQGSVDVARGVRVICHCDDCQAYAHALGRPDVLDEWGGTDVWQTYPRHVTLTTGLEQLRCLRLSERGLMRWHSGCCQTPIGNTVQSAKVPFIGILQSFMDHRAHPRDDVLGPAERTQARFAPRPPPNGFARAPLGLIARSAWFLARGALLRAHTPTPFFNAAGNPVVTPRVLSAAERNSLRLAASR